MADRTYKYLREDIGELPVKLEHLTIYINFLPDRVIARNCLEMTVKRSLDAIELDACDLEIMGIELCETPADKEGQGAPLDYSYEKERNKLLVKLPGQIEAGERICVRALTCCYPSEHILEGIYRDTTPSGAPQQYMSQCQQWGFQRIMPIFDDCRAKCSMTTTLEGDAAYTHLISNGNISLKTNPDGKPVPKPGDPTRQIITYENPVPMAPYLFIACAGTWDALVDSVTYDSGRTARLEYLVPPGATDGAKIPMQILQDSILWVRKTQDYEYTGDTYRTICMNKSNFGGMENVGNTTIVTDAALIHEHTLDLSLLYAHAVIVHEFEHNQCGSETTMESPFDVWLNEAYTVDVERQFMADVFNPSFIRLQQVDSIRNPLLGPLTIEDAGYAGRIVRDGFNNPDELIDGVTYVKAAEVIRMLRLVTGAEKFLAGKNLYFSRYHFGNANTDQFFECFEEASGISLELFKKGWLYTIGYPKVSATSSYDAKDKSFRILFEQEPTPHGAPFHTPIMLALVDESGKDIPGSERTFQLKESKAELVLEHVASPPAFVSLNRGYSFYGTFKNRSATRESLVLQARLDPDVYNRVDAMRQLTDEQRIKLLNDPEAEIDPQWLELFGEILGNRSLPSSLKAYLLRIDEQPMDRGYITWYRELVAAREKLMRAVNGRYKNELESAFQELDTYVASTSDLRAGIEDRMLKGMLLDLIVIDDSQESWRLTVAHFRAATTASDRVSALGALNRSSAPTRRAVLEEVYGQWRDHLSGYANYLRIISSGTQPDVFDMIDAEKRRPTFDVAQPTWSRALFLPMAANNKMVWTDEGIQWLTDIIIELSPVNATTTSRLLNTFQHVQRLREPLKEKVTAALEVIVREVPDKVNSTIHGQAQAYLGVAPKG